MMIIILSMYRIKQNFGGKIFWRNWDFEMLAEKFWRSQGLPVF